jgi:hypothetical protein
MAEQITEQELANLIELVSHNFKFKMPEGFEVIFNMIYSQVNHLDRMIVQKKIEQLLLTSNKDWNEKYGFAGYPSLSDWIVILVGEKPLTDEQLYIAKKEHEDKLTLYAKFIVVWLNDSNLTTSFCSRYQNEENNHLKLMIDRYCKVKEELTRERIIKMAAYLKKNYQDNKELFFTQMREIADDQNQLLLTSN